VALQRLAQDLGDPGKADGVLEQLGTELTQHVGVDPGDTVTP
jgi:hypothetical protein